MNCERYWRQMCCSCVGGLGYTREVFSRWSEGDREMKNSVTVYAGQMVRQRRWMLEMTLQQLGDRVDLTAQQIMKIEAGTYEINASLMRDIAEALEVSALFFFEGVEVEGVA